jgi:transcriptional regulator GlxA family with amidase domain
MREDTLFDGRTSFVGVAAGAGLGRRAPWGVSLSLAMGVTLAESAINAMPEAPHTTEALARAAGLSARSLTRGFQQLRGHSPMTALRHSRLERVRMDLMRGAAGGTVTEAAVRWGFFHLGRFSSLYAARFGELPSVTRRRAVAAGYRETRPQAQPVRVAS